MILLIGINRLGVNDNLSRRIILVIRFNIERNMVMIKFFSFTYEVILYSIYPFLSTYLNVFASFYKFLWVNRANRDFFCLAVTDLAGFLGLGFLGLGFLGFK